MLLYLYTERMLGGVIDPETGRAMEYERTVEIELQETQRGGKKRVKKTIEKTSWLGLPKPGLQKPVSK